MLPLFHHLVGFTLGWGSLVVKQPFQSLFNFSLGKSQLKNEGYLNTVDVGSNPIPSQSIQAN